MYSIFGYGSMIDDSVRTDAYAQSLRQAVRPGTAVLDIGTGTGILALLACKFGARRVYAIEPSDIIQVARETAAANGFADRIEFIQVLSSRVTLPEAVDVIVSDIHGVLPMQRQSLLSIIDARERFLAPGGTLIPQSETMWAAVVEAPKLYSRHTSPWDDNKYGFDMRPAKRIVTNSWRSGRVKPEQLLVEPQCWATLDYHNLESPDVSGRVTWTTTAAGTAHGLSVWFDSKLAEGVAFSNAPAEPETIFGNAFFPWTEPVNLAVGDQVSVSLGAKMVGEQYVWRWETRVLGSGDPKQVKAEYQQSTFFGAPISPAQLRKRATGYVPTLNEEAKIDLLILESMDGTTPLEEIARRLTVEFPVRFGDWNDALARVGELSLKHSQ